MATFKFRLQSVLELRQQQEKDQERRFSQEKKRLNELLGFGEQLKREHALWAERYLAAAEKGISPAHAAQIHFYLGQIQDLMERNDARIQAQSQTVEKERLALIDRIKERKLLEALRDRQYERFQREERWREEKEIEDIINTRSVKGD